MSKLYFLVEYAKQKKKNKLLSGDQWQREVELLCQHPSLTSCFPGRVRQVCVLHRSWELKQSHRVCLQQNKMKVALRLTQAILTI